MKYIFLLVLFVQTFQVNGQPRSVTLKTVLDEVLDLTESISLYTESVNWIDLRKRIYKASKKAKNVAELKPAFDLLFNSLRDHHARVLSVGDYSILGHFTDYENIRYQDDRITDSEIWNGVQDANARFEFELLEDTIGYLKVVGIGPNVDGQAEAERIRNAIYTLNAKGVKQWIVDLRYNGGGNANIMLSGLAPLYDTNQIASIRNGDGSILGRAEIINGNYRFFGVEGFPIDNNQIIEIPKIAVLTSRYTLSSGELVAVAFKGQKNVRFFGEATGGYTTNTSGDIIQDAVILIVATGFFCDRNGTPYVHNVPIDVPIDFKIEADKLKDESILAAKSWLIND